MNIDRDRPNSGRLLLFSLKEATHWRHATLKNVSVTGSSVTGSVEFSPYPFDLPHDEQQQSEPKEVFAGVVCGTIDGNELRVTLRTPKGPPGTNGEIVIGCVETDAPSVADHTFGWSEFKEWGSSLPLENCPLIFRGQEKATYRLKTSLHRTGRRDLIRYRQEDLPVLAGYVSGVTGRAYRLNDFHDYNNLLSVAQHHGYPTLLLDWTESPYIAAYFGFRALVSVGNGACRVYALNIDELQCDSGAGSGALETPFLSLYPVRAAARDHNRALPQQSVFLLSNVVEIEVFVTKVEEQTHKRYLTKIDLPKVSAKGALAELRMMGITEASLFPGLDGICKGLRDRFFG
ncbi:MAG TPA: FRG domain-containing protein [Burkholderiales bacterium]|nr:FRG domain-containing protein [Burkholderiales bacterium]